MGETMVGLVIGVAVVVLIAATGVYMLVSGDATPLHDYHRANVLPQDLAPLARWSGLGTLMMGVGLLRCLCLPIYARARPVPAWARGRAPVVIGGILLLGGLALLTLSVLHYNGGVLIAS